MADMTADFPVGAGDRAEIVQISPCVGGVLRTWTSDGDAMLWSVAEDEWLRDNQAVGIVSTTEREARRFREAGMLHKESGTLFLMSRFPVRLTDDSVNLDSHMVGLEPTWDPGDAAIDEFEALLGRAIAACVDRGEFLVVELGGWDAPFDPYCLFIVTDEGSGPVNTIETAPAPERSEFWAPYALPDGQVAKVSAAHNPESTAIAPVPMLDAIAEWQASPWDLAFTFGRF